MKTDIQIARECQLVHINEIATQLGINPEEIDPYGRYMAKVPVKLIDEEKVKKSRLILDVILNLGSEMIVVIAGDMLRMPGLPKSPQAERITIENGEIEGLS